jgi:hypothetical protein
MHANDTTSLSICQKKAGRMGNLLSRKIGRRLIDLHKKLSLLD